MSVIQTQFLKLISATSDLRVILVLWSVGPNDPFSMVKYTEGSATRTKWSVLNGKLSLVWSDKTIAIMVIFTSFD